MHPLAVGNSCVDHQSLANKECLSTYKLCRWLSAPDGDRPTAGSASGVPRPGRTVSSPRGARVGASNVVVLDGRSEDGCGGRSGDG